MSEIRFWVDQLVARVFPAVAGWFGSILESSGMLSFWLSFVFLVLLFRFILGPIFGVAQYSAASDVVKGVKENARYKGSYERNQTGKYLKKGD